MKLIAIWLLNLFDYIMTVYYVDTYGIWIEQNPLMRELLPNPILTFVIKMGIPTLCCILCYLVKDKPIIKVATWVLLIFYTWVAINHILIGLTN